MIFPALLRAPDLSSLKGEWQSSAAGAGYEMWPGGNLGGGKTKVETPADAFFGAEPQRSVCYCRETLNK